MPFDYSTAPPQRAVELIPAGTVAAVIIHIRPGNAGEDGLLKRSQKGDCEMLEIEYQVVDGEHARKKFWEYQIIVGTTQGQKDMADAYCRTRKKILQSARGIKEGDQSPQARAAYLADLKDFDNLNFIAKIGIEKGKPKNDGSGENYSDRNILATVITPDRKEWHPVVQAPPFDPNGGGGGAAPSSPGSPPPTDPPITPPKWAQ